MSVDVNNNRQNEKNQCKFIDVNNNRQNEQNIASALMQIITDKMNKLKIVNNKRQNEQIIASLIL